MPERERPEAFDVSEQFLAASTKDFVDFLKSISGAQVIISMDLDQKRLDFITLQELMGTSQISKFTIRATEKERQDNTRLFTVAGVIWEKK